MKGHSKEATPGKQESLRKIAGKLGGILSHQKWMRPIFVDAMAGDGVASQGFMSSPQILQGIANQFGFDFRAIEKDEERFKSLVDVVGEDSALHGMCQDSLKLIDLESYRGGLIYFDPNGSEINAELDAMVDQASRLDCGDILINVTATGLKRTNLYRTAQLRHGFNKRFWYVRRPIGKWQWVMMLGTSTDKIDPIPAIGFVQAWTDEGKDILAKCDHTNRELQELQSISETPDFPAFC